MLTGLALPARDGVHAEGGDHIRIDIFSGKFSPRTRAIIDLAGYAVLLPLTIWLTLYLYRYFHAGWVTEREKRPVGAEHAGVAVPPGVLRGVPAARAADPGRSDQELRALSGSRANSRTVSG